MNTMSIEIEYSNSLRLCQLRKWDHFDGYGFNLHAEKGKPGQYIGKVDDGSPAQAAGLKEGDRIIEVNGVNIANETHKQVVQRIKASPGDAKLLVVDAEGENYFKSKNIVLKSSLPYVVNMKTPASPNLSASDDSHNPPGTPEDNQSEKSTKSLQSENENILNQTDTTDNMSNNSKSSSNADEKTYQQNALNLNMTAKELRAQLAARKKYDPKKDSTIDFKKKYEIVQKL